LPDRAVVVLATESAELLAVARANLREICRKFRLRDIPAVKKPRDKGFVLSSLVPDDAQHSVFGLLNKVGPVVKTSTCHHDDNAINIDPGLGAIVAPVKPSAGSRAVVVSLGVLQFPRYGDGDHSEKGFEDLWTSSMAPSDEVIQSVRRVLRKMCKRVIVHVNLHDRLSILAGNKSVSGLVKAIAKDTLGVSILEGQRSLDCRHPLS